MSGIPGECKGWSNSRRSSSSSTKENLCARSAQPLLQAQGSALAPADTPRPQSTGNAELSPAKDTENSSYPRSGEGRDWPEKIPARHCSRSPVQNGLNTHFPKKGCSGQAIKWLRTPTLYISRGWPEPHKLCWQSEPPELLLFYTELSASRDTRKRKKFSFSFLSKGGLSVPIQNRPSTSVSAKARLCWMTPGLNSHWLI